MKKETKDLKKGNQFVIKYKGQSVQKLINNDLVGHPNVRAISVSFADGPYGMYDHEEHALVLYEVI